MVDPAVGILVMRAFYGINAVAAGSEGFKLLLGDTKGMTNFWGAPVTPPLAAHVLGSAWVGVALTSIAGLFAPVTFSPLLLFQSVYKSVILLKSTIPALLRGQARDRPAIKMGLMFSTWTLILPFFLPWNHLTAEMRPSA